MTTKFPLQRQIDDDVTAPLPALTPVALKESDVEAIAADIGLVKMPKHLTALAKLGIHAQQLGIVNTVRGTTLCTLDCMITIMALIQDKMKPETDLDTLVVGSKATTELARAIAMANATVVKTDTSMAHAQAAVVSARKTMASFEPGQKV